MAIEIKLNTLVGNKTPRISALYRINSVKGLLQPCRKDILSSYDYYTVIEADDDRGVIVCWDEDQEITDGFCYIVEFCD